MSRRRPSATRARRSSITKRSVIQGGINLQDLHARRVRLITRFHALNAEITLALTVPDCFDNVTRINNTRSIVVEALHATDMQITEARAEEAALARIAGTKRPR
jgi:hypothetical protein